MEKQERKAILDLVQNICESNYKAASESLAQAIELKLKNRIKNLGDK